MDLENPSNRYLREPLAALGLIPAMELDSYLALIELAKAGIGPVLLPAGLLALVGEQGTQARPLPGLGRPLHLVYRPNSLKRDRIARLVQALQAISGNFRHWAETQGPDLRSGPRHGEVSAQPSQAKSSGYWLHTSLADITRRRSPAAA
jgi:hypothetical protein